MKSKKTFLNLCGLLGVISLLSYVAAVVFAPLAYHGYNWMSQAVSDLSAENAPSLQLWNQLSCLYGVCGIVCCMLACLWIQKSTNRVLRIGIYLFTIMNWISQVGFTMFPLSDRGYAGTFQDVMHMAATGAVVLLSIASLICIIVGGKKDKDYRVLGICAAAALTMMLLGAVLSGAVPIEYFGIAERLSVFAAAGFNGALGIIMLVDAK